MELNLKILELKKMEKIARKPEKVYFKQGETNEDENYRFASWIDIDMMWQWQKSAYLFILLIYNKKIEKKSKEILREKAKEREKVREGEREWEEHTLKK